jgi:hypothetical protein
MNANKAYYALHPLLKSQSVLRAEKIKICKTLISLVATYGVVSWALNTDIAKCWLLSRESYKKNVWGN